MVVAGKASLDPEGCSQQCNLTSVGCLLGDQATPGRAGRLELGMKGSSASPLLSKPRGIYL